MDWYFLGEAPFPLWSFAVFWVCLAAFAGLEFFIPQRTASEREGRWPTNFSLGAVNMAIVPLVPVSAVLAAQWAHSRGVGVLNTLDMTGAWWWIVVPTATIVIRSLANYLAHFAFHKIPVLWRLHRVHHFDTTLDISTGVRTHPTELVVALLIAAPVSIAFGLHPATLIFYETVDFAFSLFSHANIRLPPRLDSLLRLVIVTPGLHAVHHSCCREQTDSNYGTVFTTWDRIFGTYCELEKDRQPFEIGLSEVRDQRASSFWWQMKSPLLQIVAPTSGLSSIKSSPSKRETAKC